MSSRAHELAAALEAAWSRLWPSAPLPRQAAELLLAQVFLETAVGTSLHGNNPGNISAGPSWTGDVWRPPWYDEPTADTSARNRRLHEEMLAGRAPAAFRAYPTLAAGFEDYLRQLRRTFPSLLAAAYSGDAARFARAMRDSNYCPDCDPPPYATVEGFQRRIRSDGLFANLKFSAGRRDMAPRTWPLWLAVGLGTMWAALRGPRLWKGMRLYA